MADLHTPRSLIITLYGAYGRGEAVGAPMPIASLIRLLAAVDVDAPSVRSAVSRLKRRGLLIPARTARGAAGYTLSEDARQLLDDGDRRIYARIDARAEPRLSDGWVLAVFSVPEAERAKRHVLRSHLARLGFGTAAPGVWIAPGGLYEETRHTLERLQLAEYVDLFRGDHLGFAATADTVARWWDLSGIAALHDDFLRRHEPVLRYWEERDGAHPTAGATDSAASANPAAPSDPASPVDPATAERAYRDYLLTLDSWRHLPYSDPGLPTELLPENWPGGRSAEVFTQLHTRLRDAGAAFVRTQPAPVDNREHGLRQAAHDEA